MNAAYPLTLNKCICIYRTSFWSTEWFGLQYLAQRHFDRTEGAGNWTVTLQIQDNPLCHLSHSKKKKTMIDVYLQKLSRHFKDLSKNNEFYCLSVSTHLAGETVGSVKDARLLSHWISDRFHNFLDRNVCSLLSVVPQCTDRTIRCELGLIYFISAHTLHVFLFDIHIFFVQLKFKI